MNRRGFLSLLGSAPLVALTPPKAFSFLWSNPVSVVAASSTLNSFNEILKQYYASEKIGQLYASDRPFFGMVKQSAIWVPNG